MAALAAIAGAALAGSALAQPAALGPAISASEIAAAIARARAEIKPGQPLLSQGLIAVAPYRANLEYRPSVGPAAIHDREAEFFYVVDGAGTVTTGGALIEPGAPANGNISGKGITGGATRSVAKGDMFIVPAGVPHWFGTISNGPLILVSRHMPRGE
jgi:mannose-6-phosphate isomerase-like protein (cupin superfamily)